MRKTKKILSVLSAMAIMCQVGISAPLVLAEEEAAASSKVGLILNVDGTNGFYVPEDLTSPAKIEYNKDGYATFTGEGTWKDGTGENAKTSPYVYASLGEDKIKFEDDKTVVVETKVRFRDMDTALNAVKIGYNLPASGIDTFVAKDKNTGADIAYGPNVTTHMVEFRAANANSSYMRFGSGTYWADQMNFSPASDIDDQWFTVIMKIKPGFIFDYDVYNEAGTLIADKNDKDQTYVTKSDYFENVAFTMTHGTYGTKTDIDYIKVYNVPTTVADDYADYTKAYDEKADKIVLNLDGGAEDTWKAASGITPTVAVNKQDADGTTYTRISANAASDYMYAALPQKIKLNDNNTVIIDTRVRGYEIDNGGGRMQIKWNMPTVSSATPALVYNGTDTLPSSVTYNESLGKYTVTYSAGANHLVLADFLKSGYGVRLSNGIVSTMPAQTAWNENLKNYTSGVLNNKWWRVVIQMKPGYEMVYKLYDENNNLVGTEQTGTLGWIEQSGYLRNIAIQSFSGVLQYADVDYLRVYNVPLGEEDSYEVDGTIDGVALENVARVNPNSAVINLETAYDANNAVISYSAWDGTTATLSKDTDYTVTKKNDNSYTINFNKALKRSATYSISLSDTVKVEFDTEEAPETLYYDGFSSKASLNDWELDFSGTYGDTVASADEKIDVKDGKLVVTGDISYTDSDVYNKLSAANIYAYKYGSKWSDYEYSFTYSADKMTQLNAVARYKRIANDENGMQYLYGVSSKHYVQYGNRLYFGYMQGGGANSKNDGRPLQSFAKVAEYDDKYNNTETYPTVTEPQRRYTNVLQLDTEYKTTVKVSGLEGYWAVESANDDSLFYESAENGAMIDLIYSDDTNPGTIAIANGLNNVLIDEIVVKDLGLYFSIDGNTKAVDENGINIVFSEEIASADGVIVKDANGNEVPSAAILAEDGKTVTVKPAAVAGEYTVEVSGVKAVDGTAMQETKSFSIITTSGEEYSLTIEKSETDTDVSAICKVNYPEVLSTKGAIVYIAVYDKGKLVSVDSEMITAAETTVTVQKSGTAKVFLWDKNMTPVEYELK